MLSHDGGVLIAKRKNEPAKGEWFWPGGRLRKGEPLEHGVRRVAREELGIEIDIEGRLGVYSHFWDTSAVAGGPSQHTVNVVYVATPTAADFEIELNEQHGEYRFLTEMESELHEYVVRYVEEGELFDYQ